MQDIPDSMTCSCSNLIGYNWISMFFMEMIFQISPIRIAPMSNKYSRKISYQFFFRQSRYFFIFFKNI